MVLLNQEHQKTLSYMPQMIMIVIQTQNQDNGFKLIAEQELLTGLIPHQMNLQ